MSRITLLLLPLSLVAATLLVACSDVPAYTDGRVAGSKSVLTVTPSNQAATPMAAAGTPSPVDAQALQQQIRYEHLEMLQVLQQLSRLDPQRQRQVGGLMVDLMAEMGLLMAALQPAMDLMTPEERQAAAGNLQRTEADIQGMYGLMPGATPGPSPTMGSGVSGAGPVEQAGTPDMDRMGQEMEGLHRQMQGQLQQMDLSQIQAVGAYMVDTAGNLDRLRPVMEPAFGRMSPEQRQALGQSMDRMQATIEQMMQVAGIPDGTPSPSPTGTPAAS